MNLYVGRNPPKDGLWRDLLSRILAPQKYKLVAFSSGRIVKVPALCHICCTLPLLHKYILLVLAAVYRGQTLYPNLAFLW